MPNEEIMMYVKLIERGKLTIEQVPEQFREQVQEELDKTSATIVNEEVITNAQE